MSLEQIEFVEVEPKVFSTCRQAGVSSDTSDTTNSSTFVTALEKPTSNTQHFI